MAPVSMLVALTLTMMWLMSELEPLSMVSVPRNACRVSTSFCLISSFTSAQVFCEAVSW